MVDQRVEVCGRHGAFVATYVFGMRAVGCIDAADGGRCDELAYAALWIGLLGLVGSRVWQVLDD